MAFAHPLRQGSIQQNRIDTYGDGLAQDFHLLPLTRFKFYHNPQWITSKKGDLFLSHPKILSVCCQCNIAVVIFAVSVSSVRIVHLHSGSYYSEFGAAIESIACILLSLIGESKDELLSKSITHLQERILLG